MFVQSSTEVPFGLHAVRAEMLASVHFWLQPLLEEAMVEGRVLVADLVPSQPTVRGGLNVTVGAPWVGESMASIPFRARMDAEPWANFNGHLTAGWFGERYTQLDVDAHYHLPCSPEPRERLLLHRVVQAMSHQFLAKVALELSERVCTRGG